MTRFRPAKWLLACCCSVMPTLAAAAVTCSVTATGPAFGVYDPLNVTPTVANGQVSTTCTLTSGGATTVNLVTSFSTGNSGSYALRTMLSGANQLNYNIFKDAAYTQILGNGTGGSQTIVASLTLNGGNRTKTSTSTLYGRVPASQDVAAGSYTDTITVTVTYRAAPRADARKIAAARRKAPVVSPPPVGNARAARRCAIACLANVGRPCRPRRPGTHPCRGLPASLP